MIGELGIELRLIVVGFTRFGIPTTGRVRTRLTTVMESHIDVFFYTIKPIELYTLKNILQYQGQPHSQRGTI